MAKLIINDRDVTVSLSAVVKLEALHGDVVVPRSAVAQVRTVSIFISRGGQGLIS